jgi:hypothetical protein
VKKTTKSETSLPSIDAPDGEPMASEPYWSCDIDNPINTTSSLPLVSCEIDQPTLRFVHLLIEEVTIRLEHTSSDVMNISKRVSLRNLGDVQF